MPDNKLTDNEIIKALEYCASEKCDCSKCKLYVANDDDCNCSRNLKLKAVEIYKRQRNAIQDLNEQLIEALKNAAINKTKVIDYEKEINRLQAENEKLCAEIDELIIAKDLLFDEAEALIKKVKAEAYKEFADRLCEITRYHPEFSHYCIQEEKFDNLLKELVGENGC